MTQKECMRCERLGRESKHPISDFYRDSSGKPLSTCKRCRKEQSHDYHSRMKKEERKMLPEKVETTVPGSLARTVVLDPPNGPKIAIWRCMSCYAKETTRGRGHEAPRFPESWRHMPLEINGETMGIILCAGCSAQLLKARRILARISERVEAEAKEESEAV